MANSQFWLFNPPIPLQLESYELTKDIQSSVGFGYPRGILNAKMHFGFGLSFTYIFGVSLG